MLQSVIVDFTAKRRRKYCCCVEGSLIVDKHAKMSLASLVGNTSVRRAEFDDVKLLNTAVTENGGLPVYKATFGAFNFNTVIENSFLTLTSNLTNDQSEQSIAVMVLNDTINLTSNDSNAFARTIKALKAYIPVTMNNTLFLNFWLLNDKAHYKFGCGTDIMNAAFAMCPELDFIVWLVPEKIVPSDFCEKNFSEIEVQKDPDAMKKSAEENLVNNPLLGFKPFFLHRSNFMPKLNVREARVEDNDDLIPIIQQSNPDVLLSQDGFFLADLIQSHDEKNKFFVGLNQNNQVAGMLATSYDVNVALIMKMFDIDAFADMVIKEPEKPLPPPLLISIVGDLRLVDIHAIEDIVTENDCMFVNMELATAEWEDMQRRATKETVGVGAGGAESKEEKAASENEEEATSTSKPFSLQQYIENMVLHSEKHATVAPAAFIIYGYPRTEAETLEKMNEIIFNFDVILELQNSSEDLDDEEDDEFLQQHLDGLEVLKEHYFNDNAKAGKNHAHRSAWRKVVIDGEIRGRSENASLLGSELSRLLNYRTMKIEAQRERDAALPPKANAFAITLFCMDQGTESRATDLLQIAFEENPQDYCLFMMPNSRPPSHLTRSLSLVKMRPGLSFDQSLYIMHRSYFLIHNYLHVSRLSADYGVTTLEKYAIAQNLSDMQRDALLNRAAIAIQEGDVELQDNPGDVSFVVRIGEKETVGVVQVTKRTATAEDLAWLRCHFEIDELVHMDRHRPRAVAFISNFHMSPRYSRATRFVIREIMRMYGRTLLLFQNDPYSAPPAELALEMVPVLPRKRAQSLPGPSSAATDTYLASRPSAASGGLDHYAPLYLISKKHLSKPKEIVTKRVVIVGGSSHSYSLMEQLSFLPDVFYSNIYLLVNKPPRCMVGNSATTIVSSNPEEDAAEESKHDNNFSGCFTPEDACFPSEQELEAMGLAFKVAVVQGSMTDIDREAHAVVVSDSTVIEYDLLIVSTPTQDYTTKKLKCLAGMHPARCADAGIFELGNPAADLLALRWVRKRHITSGAGGQQSKADGGTVVLAGLALHVFHAANTLLQLGISAEHIVCSVLEEAEQLEEMDSERMSDLLRTSVEGSGIKVRWCTQLADCTFTRNGFVNEVTLTSSGRERNVVNDSSTAVELSAAQKVEKAKEASKAAAAAAAAAAGHGGESKAGDSSESVQQTVGNMEVHVPCSTVLCCGPKQCDRDVFTAVNDSGLVFDGGLVVNPSFCTRDPAIYSVSDFSRFSRTFRQAVPHARYNACEIGQYVANILIEHHLYGRSGGSGMDAAERDLMGWTASFGGGSMVSGGGSGMKAPLPVFTQPRSRSGCVPGGMYFFVGKLPKISEESSIYMSVNEPEVGVVNVEKKIGMMRVSIDSLFV